tara:strand:+ start:14563 stop:15312 length:750 start_codon:yes stop_codon:yes gene_type:complete
MSTHKIGLNEAQIEALTAPTPEEDILTRPGAGFEMSYVTGEYVKRTMLNVFGGAMRYQVLNHVVDKGSLILHVSIEYPLYENHKNGSVLSDTWGRIEEFGTSSIRSDFGQAWKTAFTDALKRASTHLGVGLDLYHKTQEEKETADANTKPAWVEAAESVNQKSAQAPKAQSFGGGASCSPAQKGLIMYLLSELGHKGDVAWLSEKTGVPQEQLGKISRKDDPECLPVDKTIASSIITELKELQAIQASA